MNSFRMFAMLIFFSGCSITNSDDHQLVVPNASLKNGDTFVVKGTVRYIDLEGGFYAIAGTDGQNYDPINLDESFQQDGLDVAFLVEIAEEYASFHMYGIPIKIIQVIKNG